MSKSRKVLGALLAVVMVLSVLSISAFAAGGTSYEEDASFTQSWSLGTPVSLGGNQYKVDVILSTNYEVGPVSFKLEGVTSIPAEITVGAGYYAGALTDKSDSGLVLMIPDTSGAGNIAAKSCNNAVIATVTYTTNNANGAVTIAKDVKHAGNPNGSLVAARCTSGSVNKSDFVVGQTTTVSGELVYEVSGEPTPPPVVESADLAVKSGVLGVIIDTNKKFGNAYDGVVYGDIALNKGENKISSGAHYDSFFTATNGGSVTAVKSIYSGRVASWGTGTTLQVKNADGTVAKTYLVVIIGDVDGNGIIDTGDVGLILSEAMNPSLPEIKKMAANCYYPSRGSASVIAGHLYNVDTNDLGLVLQQAMAYNALDFSAIGDKHSQYNTYYQ